MGRRIKCPECPKDDFDRLSDCAQHMSQSQDHKPETYREARNTLEAQDDVGGEAPLPDDADGDDADESGESEAIPTNGDEGPTPTESPDETEGSGPSPEPSAEGSDPSPETEGNPLLRMPVLADGGGPECPDCETPMDHPPSGARLEGVTEEYETLRVETEGDEWWCEDCQVLVGDDDSGEEVTLR